MSGKLQNNGYEDIAIGSQDNETISLKNAKNLKQDKSNILKYLEEFGKNTKIYGFNYLTEPSRFKVEKCYWLIFISISFCICMNLLVGLWVNWNQDSILILRQNPKPIWQIPFPAITICPETKVRQSVYNFTDYYHKVLGDNNLTTTELKTFADTSLVCDNHLHTSGDKTTNSDVIEYLTNVAPSLQETFFGCKWISLNDSCQNLFTPIITEDGLCFTFNMLSNRDIFNKIVNFQDEYINYSDGWTLENGYLDKNKNTFPRRTTTTGPKGGFYILLKTDEQDFDYVCRGPVRGFKIHLHQPSEIPSISSSYFRAAINQEVLVTVKPNLITSSPNLKEFGPDERQCFFANERSLKFFKNYNQKHCRIECVTNITLKNCGCVAFHMPREKSTPICASGSNACMFEAEQELFEDDLQLNMCDCLPACTSLTYNAEISQADFNWPKIFQAFTSDITEFSNTHMTRIVIFFDNMQFDASVRTMPRSSYAEFLAHCGGLLLLFTGFSFLSVAEIIYFLSLRLICNIKKYGKHRWTGVTKSTESITITNE